MTPDLVSRFGVRKEVETKLGGPILVIGPTGLVGGSVKNYFVQKSYPVFGASRTAYQENGFLWCQVDATNKEEILRLLRIKKPGIIIDCAGPSDVDQCQAFYRPGGNLMNNEAYRGIVGRVESVCRAIDSYQRESGKKVPYILASTGYVLGGNGTFDEYATRRITTRGIDINYYSFLKIEAERAIDYYSRMFDISYLTTRFDFPHDQSHVAKSGSVVTMWRLLSEGKSVTGVTDLMMTPTHCRDIARTVGEFIDRKEWEKSDNHIRHIAGKAYTGLQVANILARELIRRGVEIDVDGQIKVSTVEKQYEGRAPRPVRGSLVPSRGVHVVDFEDEVKNFVLPEGRGGGK